MYAIRSYYANLLPGLELGLIRYHLHEFGLRLLGRHPRYPFEILFRPADDLLEFGVPPLEPVLLLGKLLLPLPELLRTGLEGFRLPVEHVLFLQKALFELADLVLPLPGFPP